jgi:hypothetical protein
MYWGCRLKNSLAFNPKKNGQNTNLCGTELYSTTITILKVSKTKIIDNLLVGWGECDVGVPNGFVCQIFKGIWLVLITTILGQMLLQKLNINWVIVYHQYIHHIAYYITIYIPTHNILNVTLSVLTKNQNLYALLAHISMSHSACI